MTAAAEPITRQRLRAPFPWYGGKARASALIWARFGTVRSYVEPFAGSLAVLLGRPDPDPSMIETVNDLDCYVANAWRGIAFDPEAVAHYADWPVVEIDLRARHRWLARNKPAMQARLEEDPEYFDPKAAGWWVWGVSCWIGDGWCSSKAAATGESVKRPHLTEAGMGVHAVGAVHSKRPSVERGGRGVQRSTIDSGEGIRRWFLDLQARLRRVRVLCGDWRRCVGPALTTSWAETVGVLLDPPYDPKMRKATLYAQDAPGLSKDVRLWALEAGQDKRMRIALCGLEGEHAMPDDWEVVSWKAASETRNADKERIWFSPGCLRPDAGQLAMEF